MPILDLSRLQAFWIDRTAIAIPLQYFRSDWTYTLLASEDASLEIRANEANAILLSPAGLNQAQATRYPHLARWAVFRLPDNLTDGSLRRYLKGQMAFAARDGSGTLQYLTGVQLGGILDDLFPYSGPLGARFGSAQEKIRITLWAPTARSVDLLLYEAEADATPAAELPMAETDGVWSTECEPAWQGKYYLYRITLYAPTAEALVQSIVTDPYSADLALNGSKTRITDLRAAWTKPDGWDTDRSPELESKNDLSIYELHVRDFSASDESVAAEQRGTYLAFANPGTNGMRHLKQLADAGLAAIHLLPTSHFGSVNEDKSKWQSPGDLSVYPPDGDQQQAAVHNLRTSDAFNWGYDPVHYMAPAGAHASNPAERVKEYRQMVMALHQAGLRVIQDVVFNHTVASGQHANSVLDKVAPGYYHRFREDGTIETTSCGDCANTASENRMMEKLMVDALVQYAREYRIDGFRFDLMGLHLISNLQSISKALSELTVERDGVDGSKIYLYGEGWNIGETASNARGPNASQWNMHGTGIGTFNDRIRDGIRGGNPFNDQRLQGFATGLSTSASEYTRGIENESDQRWTLLHQADWVRAGLAGNLREFAFTSSGGQRQKAVDIDYNGQGTGYAASPIETINFCSVHDNQTLFAAVQLKAPYWESIEVRARRQTLAMSVVTLAQGIPFFLAGDDLLRTKDMDGNSYDSGDWFNRLDFSYQSAIWGIGLPMASENVNNWFVMRPLLSDPAFRPKQENIVQVREAFREFLRIRKSSRLFRMETAAEVERNLHFLNTGPQQLAGLIVMTLDAAGGDYGAYRHLIVCFNARPEPAPFQNDEWKNRAFELHPVQKASEDAVVRAATFDRVTGTAIVPGLTTAVWVLTGD